eukprot:12911884-Prorocentrum_lima.AAC.1
MTGGSPIGPLVEGWGTAGSGGKGPAWTPQKRAELLPVVTVGITGERPPCSVRQCPMVPCWSRRAGSAARSRAGRSCSVVTRNAWSSE